MKLLAFSITCFCVLTAPSSAKQPVRAVNLGGWLVTEGWIKPSLFDGIPNKDFLDGTSLQLKSVTLGKYLSAENGGGSIIVANRTDASGWESFALWRINETTFNFRVFNKQFVGINTSRNSSFAIQAEANTPGVTETFEIHWNPTNSSLVRIKASNKLFLQVKAEELVTADYEGDDEWGNNNPSVFILTISRTLQGEYQITNGYGPHNASIVMKNCKRVEQLESKFDSSLMELKLKSSSSNLSHKRINLKHFVSKLEHWNTFIREKDFKFISDNGLDTTRIPVGWWTAHDPSPPSPYVGGSLQALDKAFEWAKKYGIKVILDLHAAPGSQNGNEHSSSRDGSQEWGQTDDNINQTVHVIDFLTKRYAKNPSLYAVELINEPTAPGVSLQTLTKFYKYGYDAVRKHSKTAYVVLSNRLGPSEPRELFNLTKGMTKAVIDVHYYNLFWDYYSTLTVDQNIEYVYTNRTAELKELTITNGPLILVGEWVAELALNNLTMNDIQRYGEAQLQVFGNATFGWAYWTFKNVNNHWSLEWMINNGYINTSSF
ncbi:glucan 1 3-beta-glucosidase a [Phtheirospermum japonicum]|uniref:Glucan 1 3-beta-glucosidase a n=1 Tax=Phtheirospermum japonicum TaxID=374723 RepID=A0A830DIZ7_9LAMI|nr:glucan 1 3-beta-glucosidase a [Phtheirospermum japonicum]